MPTNTKEIGFEEFIEQRLVAGGYRSRPASAYDKALCLDGEVALEFVQATQPEAWRKLEEQHGTRAAEKFLARLAEEVASRGVLDVFWGGIADHGVRFQLAFFRPETGFNDDARRQYEGNILTVVRQLRYSEKNDNAIDMALFMNGLPVFTVELKNQLTGQSVKNAVQQYRADRDPKEPLLAFKRCLAHFCVDTEWTLFTTRLEGLRTRFMPWDKGNDGGAGNPPNPDGYMTAYVWDDLWSRDSMLELVGRFAHMQVETKEDERGRLYKVESLVFPRYHQREAVRRLVDDARKNGAGRNYLIQHSAGSGKSNTIAWTAHRLSELHDAADAKVFDSVLVITDRRVLDKQLRDTVTQFEQTAGVVKAIVEGSKELKEALESGEKVIVTTLQKFPFIVDAIGEIPGRKFAVIIDEAHSSQTGEGAANLREALMTRDLDEAARAEGGEPETDEDLVLRKLRSRKVKTPNISFFAFTATPKQKTLEIFGTQDPTDGRFYPFSLYSMRQAIEERFILDVLKNYTTFSTYFALLKKVLDDPAFDKKKAQRLILNYVDRHEHAIEKKTAIIVEHFCAKISGEIGGQAKAMVVTRSRLHAVRFKLAFDKYLGEHGLPYKALVAFTDTVRDGALQYTEAGMNGVPERVTVEEFKKPVCRFLIVAEKFQTGFDQPLLSAMYVDKKLSGVNAVQTLSRLNRTRAGKEDVFVLDFVNEVEDIEKSFQPYYNTTVLSEATDPNILHDLERDILAFKLFTWPEVDGFFEGYFGQPPMNPAQLNASLGGFVTRFNSLLEEEQLDFHTKCRDYARKYAFIAQIAPFEDVKLEKLYTFVKLLLRKLPLVRVALPFEVLESIDMESYKLVRGKEQSITLKPETGVLEPLSNGKGGQTEEEVDPLSKIIKDVNERFAANFSSEDRVILNTLGARLMNNEALAGSVRNNAPDAAKIMFDEVFRDELVKMLNEHFTFYQKLDRNSDLKKYVNERLFEHMARKVRHGGPQP